MHGGGGTGDGRCEMRGSAGLSSTIGDGEAMGASGFAGGAKTCAEGALSGSSTATLESVGSDMPASVASSSASAWPSSALGLPPQHADTAGGAPESPLPDWGASASDDDDGDSLMILLLLIMRGVA